MIRKMITAATLVATAALLLVPTLPLPAAAQSNDYFVPNQNRPAPSRAAPAPAPRQPVRPPAPVPQRFPAPDAGVPGGAGGQTAEQEPPPVQMPMPAVPELPALPKGSAPPAGVIGVIGIPEVMRAITAAQQVDRVIGERRSHLSEDARKEQAAWRDMQQALANQRSTMSPEQIRGKERELQDRITSAQRQFRDRDRVIQEATQVSLNQIQAALIAVIRQVSESRGMNLVMHRAQVALNVAEFDITDQVAQQMNKVLPAVNIPADGVSVPNQGPAAPVPIQNVAVPVTAVPVTPGPATSGPATPAPAAPATAPVASPATPSASPRAAPAK